MARIMVFIVLGGALTFFSLAQAAFIYSNRRPGDSRSDSTQVRASAIAASVACEAREAVLILRHSSGIAQEEAAGRGSQTTSANRGGFAQEACVLKSFVATGARRARADRCNDGRRLAFSYSPRNPSVASRRPGVP